MKLEQAPVTCSSPVADKFKNVCSDAVDEADPSLIADPRVLEGELSLDLEPGPSHFPAAREGQSTLASPSHGVTEDLPSASKRQVQLGRTPSTVRPESAPPRTQVTRAVEGSLLGHFFPVNTLALSLISPRP